MDKWTEADKLITKLLNGALLKADSDRAMLTGGLQDVPERLDGIAMLYIAIGESQKNIDKITEGSLLADYPEIDWTGAKGFRDIIARHYFDIDELKELGGALLKPL